MLSNRQIDHILTYKGERLKNYGGCWPRNELLPEVGKPEEGKIYIVNLEPDTVDKVGHWVLVSNFRRDHILYFDPFGIDPAEEILKFMKRAKTENGNEKKIIISHQQYQDLESDYCGWFCIFILLHIVQGYSFSKIVQNFHKFHPWLNDKFCRDIKRA